MARGWKKGKRSKTGRTHKTASQLGWRRRKQGLTRKAQKGGINQRQK